MRNALAIFRRELAGLFGSAHAAVVLVLFVLLVALFSLVFDDVLAGSVATMQGPFFWISATFLFLVPAVTMRLIAEERRSGSIEILATLPVTAGEIVLGKWLAAVALVAVALMLTFTWPLAIAAHGELDWGPVLGGYVGLLLLGSAFAAVGTATSALTDNQILAFLGALAISVVPFVTGSFLPVVPGDLVPLVQYLTFDYHFSNLARGVLDTRSLVFFAGVVLVGLRVATLALQVRRLA